jgi:UDP-2-acetamido-2-deoxy-ribo-hexuluronate aminotransferase
MQINFIDLQAQYQKYKKDIDTQIHQVLDSSVYIGGKVAQLEEDLSSFVQCKHTIACSSGTDALVLALMAIDIQPGDEVITTPFTFIATAEAIALLKAKPVFVDIDERTFNIDVAKIENKITPKTKAVIPVSLFGQMADMESINSIAKKHNLKVIEDGAQSFGATLNTQQSCSTSDMGTTSFFPAKPLGCYGDGGAIFTNDDKLVAKLRVLLNHGQTKQYVHSHIGINGRLDALQAGVLIAKLKYYQEELETRQNIATYYDKNLKNVTTPLVLDGYTSVWAQYCIRVKNREQIIKHCEKQGVPTGVYYPIPLHMQEVFKYLGHKPDDFPVSLSVSKDILALPMSAFLTKEQQDYVIKVVNDD